jgi:hypothetical protein
MTAGTTPGRAAVADVRVRGTDRKLYSARKLTPEQLDRAIDAAHYLVCRKYMTIRAAQQAMAGTYGIRRSTGAIHADLRNYVCEGCHDPGLNS